MNNFGINITGYTGVVKLKRFVLGNNPTVEQRSFAIESGPGVSPDPGRRVVRGHWVADKASETLSSYDFEYVLDKEGKKVIPLPEAKDDTVPVVVSEAAPGLPSKDELQAKKVRRKRS